MEMWCSPFQLNMNLCSVHSLLCPLPFHIPSDTFLQVSQLSCRSKLPCRLLVRGISVLGFMTMFHPSGPSVHPFPLPCTPSASFPFCLSDFPCPRGHNPNTYSSFILSILHSNTQGSEELVTLRFS